MAKKTPGELKELHNLIEKFNDARNWKQFHNLKDVALSLVLEAGEVMEHFQWKSEADIQTYVKTHKTEIGDELSDVLYWVLLMAGDLNIDLKKAFKRKRRVNAKKYPIAKAKG